MWWREEARAEGCTHHEHTDELELAAEAPPVRTPRVEEERDEVLVRPRLWREGRVRNVLFNAEEGADDEYGEDERCDHLR